MISDSCLSHSSLIKGYDLPPAFDPSCVDVLAFARDERANGRDVAVVTLTAIEGASPRAVGAQMAVAGDGRFAGQISSGCLERAIVERARLALKQGMGGVERYGRGSKYLDIALPCGSAIDLLITVKPNVDVLNAALESLYRRRVCALEFRAVGVTKANSTSTSWRDGALRRVYRPPLRIVAAGQGAELIVLSHLARAAGHTFCAISRDQETLSRCTAEEKIHLRSASSPLAVSIDRYTAVAMLLHDREWEVALMPYALQSSAFYVGAVGSRQTQTARKEALRGVGVSDAMLARLQGPIGLLPATRDPSALAVSVLAGILAAWPHDIGQKQDCLSVLL